MDIDECYANPEYARTDMNDAMCRVLTELGYGDGISIFKSQKENDVDKTWIDENLQDIWGAYDKALKEVCRLSQEVAVLKTRLDDDLLKQLSAASVAIDQLKEMENKR